MYKAQTNGKGRAVIYARVSGDDRHNERRNLDGQIEMGRKYALDSGYAIVEELAEDDRGASGASFDLPQLGRVLDMAERRQFDVLIVREIDRLSRNLAKQLIVEERLKSCGVTIDYVLGEYPDNPEGNLMKHVRGSIAEYEREKIRERSTRGRRNMARAGKVVSHGRTLYGYQLSNDRQHLVIFEPEAQIVRMIFRWYTVGDETGARLSTTKISVRLSEMHVPTWADTHKGVQKTREAGKWCNNSIRSILRNPAYMGAWQYGKGRDDAINVEIPPIIDAQTWQAAQWQRVENTLEAKRNTRREYLMRCRLTCDCGYAVSAHCLTTRGNVYLYYRCSSWVQDYAKGGCKRNGYFSVPDLDKLVWDWLKDWLKDPADLQRKLEAYQSDRARVNAPVLELLRVNDKLIADYAAQLKRAKDMYQMGVINADELLERKVRLEATIAKLEEEREKLQGRLGRELSPQQITEVLKFAEKLARGLEKADQSFAARRRIIELLDVRAILATENGEKVVYASFVLTDTGEHGERLTMPKVTRRKLSVGDKNTPKLATVC
jgi:site-specific DNA recombinase